jgi:hypothetical protein
MNHVDRNLTVFEAHCLPNEHEFEFYGFSDFVYGERVIRTNNGQHFGLMTLDDDEVVKEVGKLLDEIYLGKLDEIERAKHFNQVFGLTCDPLNGEELNASVGVVCPTCKTTQVSYRDFTPPRFRSFSIAVISHEKWSKLNHEQKRLLLEEGLHAKGLL